MIKEFLNLRNRIHRNKFRFNLTSGLWESHYVSDKELETNNVITVVENNKLKGYVVYSLLIEDETKVCRVGEVLADSSATLIELVDRLIEKSMEKGADFIILRRCEEPYNDVFDKKRFLTFAESVIMVVLLDPRELLLSISEKVESGKVLNLVIDGFDPITVMVGKKRIMVVEDQRSGLTVSTDSKTFLRLFFGKTSFLKELFHRKIVTNPVQLSTVSRFFNIIRVKKWYIPSGDWC